MTQTRTNTKARIIAATIELLELQGYHATGLNQVTQQSASPKGSLYFHFPGGKEEMATEAVLAAGAEISQRVTVALQSATPVGEAVSAFILLLAQALQDSNFRKSCPVAMVAMETAATSEPLRQACQQVYASWFALVEQRLAVSGFDSGQAKSWAMLIWTAIEGALLLSRTAQSTAPLETVAAQLKLLLDQASNIHNHVLSSK